MRAPGLTGISGSDHPAVDSRPGELALQHEPRGPRFVTARQRPFGFPLELPDEPADPARVVHQAPLQGWLPGPKEGHSDCVLVNVEADESASFPHDRLPSSLRLWDRKALIREQVWALLTRTPSGIDETADATTGSRSLHSV